MSEFLTVIVPAFWKATWHFIGSSMVFVGLIDAAVVLTVACVVELAKLNKQGPQIN